MTNILSGTDLEARRDAIAAADRDAVILWLRDASVLTTRAARRRFAHKLILSSVFTQAHMLGLVFCSGCADQGCPRCSQCV